MGAAQPLRRPTNLEAMIATNDDIAVADLGYPVVKRFTAGASLNIGDAVYISAANTVNKSTTVALYENFVGIVVGGTSFPPTANSGAVSMSSTDVGTLAAATGEDVLVACEGSIVYARVGTADVTAATRLGPDATTAGRVRIVPASTTLITFGTALEAQATDNAAVKMMITGGNVPKTVA